MGIPARQGCIKPWHVAKRDIVRHLKEDPGSIVTTIVDYYGLPADSWPGRAFQRGAEPVESAVQLEIAGELGDNFNPRRFIPFVIMHEFEGLLFSDCPPSAVQSTAPTLRPNSAGSAKHSQRPRISTTRRLPRHPNASSTLFPATENHSLASSRFSKSDSPESARNVPTLPPGSPGSKRRHADRQCYP